LFESAFFEMHHYPNLNTLVCYSLELEAVQSNVNLWLFIVFMSNRFSLNESE